MKYNRWTVRTASFLWLFVSLVVLVTYVDVISRSRRDETTTSNQTNASSASSYDSQYSSTTAIGISMNTTEVSQSEVELERNVSSLVQDLQHVENSTMTVAVTSTSTDHPDVNLTGKSEWTSEGPDPVNQTRGSSSGTVVVQLNGLVSTDLPVEANVTSNPETSNSTIDQYKQDTTITMTSLPVNLISSSNDVITPESITPSSNSVTSSSSTMTSQSNVFTSPSIIPTSAVTSSLFASTSSASYMTSSSHTVASTSTTSLDISDEPWKARNPGVTETNRIASSPSGIVSTTAPADATSPENNKPTLFPVSDGCEPIPEGFLDRIAGIIECGVVNDWMSVLLVVVSVVGILTFVVVLGIVLIGCSKLINGNSISYTKLSDSPS